MLSRRIRWAVHVVRIRDIRGAYRVLVGRLEERPVRLRRRRKSDIKFDILDVMWGRLDLCGSGQAQVTVICKCCYDI
jgi:hypothetical protein